MIQFNLLPDVKQEFIRTQRVKRLMLSASVVASAVALSVLVIALLTVYVVQKKSIADLTSDITKNSQTLQATPNLSDMLTVQSQLNSLSALHNAKPVTSRLFSYLSELTPKQATISALHIDFTSSTITINGNAPNFDVVNTYVDALKYTNYSTTTGVTNQQAFSNVVLASFSRSSKTATYAIALTFNKDIFNVADTVTLSLGGQNIPTQPSIVFKKGT